MVNKLSRAKWMGSNYYREGKSGKPASWRNKNTGAIVVAGRRTTKQQIRGRNPVGYELTRAHSFGYNPLSKSSAEKERRRFARRRP